MISNQIIQTKEDTAAKLAAASGKPTKNYLFAPEINRLVDFVKVLATLQNFDGSLLIPSVKKELGVITGSFVDYINAHAPSAWPSPAFAIYTIDDVEYVQAFVGVAGTYGTGQLQVNAGQFVLVNQSDLQQPTLPTRRIWFGTLSATTFNSAKNTLGYTVTAAQVGDYVKTNIPFFPSLVVTIHDRYTFGIEGGGYIEAVWENVGGFLGFKNNAYDAEGVQTDGGEFSECRIQIEQL